MIEFTVKFPLRAFLRATLFFMMGWIVAVNTYRVEADLAWAAWAALISSALNAGVFVYDHIGFFTSGYPE